MTDALLTFNAAEGVADVLTASGASAGKPLIPGVQKSSALYARIYYSAAANASGSNTIQFKVQAYDPAPTTGSAGYFDHTVNANKVLTLSTTAQSGVLYLPVSTQLQQVQVYTLFAGSGTSPTISVVYDLVDSNV